MKNNVINGDDFQSVRNSGVVPIFAERLQKADRQICVNEEGNNMYLSDLLSNGMELADATELLMNIMWTLIGAFLVYFMQAGFAMVETGFTRAKNAGNICMKNMMDFVLGSIFFFLIGFALMFGGDSPIIGTSGFFNPTSLADADGMFNGLPIGVFMIFHTVFCATAATIVSGAMAERTKFSA